MPMCNKRHFASILAMTGALAAQPQPASADANLNCDAYAATAVADNQQNKTFGCGLQGPGWHSDFNAHVQWCKQDATKMVNLTDEDKARKSALAQCAQKPAQKQQACQGYAQQAVKQAKEAVSLNCGFSGGRWSGDHAGHFNWCVGVSDAAREGEAKARTDQLTGCMSAFAKSWEDGCKTYAAVAAALAETSIKRQCGFKGGRWDTAQNGHYSWCLSVGPQVASKENAIRSAALKDECYDIVCTTTRTTFPPSSTRTCKKVPKPLKQ
jgi:hypothetical protein